MSEYPEHEKLAKIQDQSQAVGDFLEEYLPAHGYQLAQFECRECEAPWMPDEDGDCAQCGSHRRGDKLWPASYNIYRILADYFGIDLKKIDAEKEAMIKALRDAQH